MRRMAVGLSLIVAAAGGTVAAQPAPAMAADRAVTFTVTCTNNTCQGSWSWYQGGTSGTLLSSGSISGHVNSTTTGTTVQPAAADTVVASVSTPPCGAGDTRSFHPGNSFNVSVQIGAKINTVKTPATYGDTCQASFAMRS